MSQIFGLSKFFLAQLLIETDPWHVPLARLIGRNKSESQLVPTVRIRLYVTNHLLVHTENNIKRSPNCFGQVLAAPLTPTQNSQSTQRLHNIRVYRSIICNEELLCTPTFMMVKGKSPSPCAIIAIISYSNMNNPIWQC